MNTAGLFLSVSLPGVGVQASHTEEFSLIVEKVFQND
jgi:hypothetical protein